MPSFGEVQLPVWNGLADFYASQRASNENTAAQQQNQLASQTLGSRAQISANVAEGGSLANQLAAQRNPLEIIQLRQQLGIDPSPTLDRLRDTFNGGGGQPSAAAPDGSAGGDISGGNPLLGPLPGLDRAGLPLNGPTPTQADANQPPGPDHPALPAVRDFATKIMAVPAEQRPVLYQQMLPAIKQAGAIHAPDQYPGDDAVSHLASGGAISPIQVAGPGAPTVPDPAQPMPAPAAPQAPQQGVDDVMARLRAAQPPIPNQNDMFSVGAPDGVVPAAPLNGMVGMAPQAAPQPQLMPAASAQPPAPAQPAQTGMNAPQVQAAQDLLRRATQIEMMAAQTPNDPRVKATAAAMAADLRGRAAILMQADSVTVGTNGVQTHSLTGKQDSAAVPTHNPARVTKVEGAGGTLLTQPGSPDRVIPYGGRPEQTDAYKADIPRAEAMTSNAQAQQSNMLRLNEMADIATHLASGPTAELRAKGAAYLEALGASPETIKGWTGMASGSMAQEFVKLSLATAGAAAKTDIGSNNGIQSTQLYLSANPGMALLPDANKRMTNMIRVASQFPQDYAQAALQHFGTNESAFLAGGNYAPLTTFNRAWLAQSNPQIGAAAMGILNGDPFDKWAARIGPAEGARAAAMVARIDPNAQVPLKGGGFAPVGQILGHPAISGAAAN